MLTYVNQSINVSPERGIRGSKGWRFDKKKENCERAEKVGDQFSDSLSTVKV